jgi:hypothetical protein
MMNGNLKKFTFNYSWLYCNYLSNVALRMEDDDVKFRRKEAGQRDGRTQADGDAHAGDPQRQMAGRTVNNNQQEIRKYRKV